MSWIGHFPFRSLGIVASSFIFLSDSCESLRNMLLSPSAFILRFFCCLHVLFFSGLFILSYFILFYSSSDPCCFLRRDRKDVDSDRRESEQGAELSTGRLSTAWALSLKRPGRGGEGGGSILSEDGGGEWRTYTLFSIFDLQQKRENNNGGVCFCSLMRII